MRRVFVFAGGSILVASGLFAAACGTDNGGTTSGTLPTAEAGGDRGNNPPPPPPPSGDGGLDGQTDPDCGNAPKLRTNTTDFFCAFVAKDAAAPDGGDNRYCKNDEVCCNPSTKSDGTNFDPSYCTADPTKGTVATSGDTACKAGAPGFTYTKGSNWECADKNNCAAGKVCCLTTGGVDNNGNDAGGNVNIGKSTDKSIPTACNALQAFKQGGTRCATSCAAGTEIQLCSNSDTNCGAGQTCTAFSGFFRDLGVCR
jgi:hypothetical protein